MNTKTNMSLVQYAVLLSLLLVGCTQANRIPVLQNEDDEIILSNWKYRQVHSDVDSAAWADFDLTAVALSSEESKSYALNADYVDIDQLQTTQTGDVLLPEASVVSKTTQECAIIWGSSSKAKLWVNGTLIGEELKDGSLKYGRNVIAAELSKGENKFVLLLNCNEGNNQFNLKVSSLDYIRKYQLINGYNCFLTEHFLLSGDTLHFKTKEPFVEINNNSRLSIVAVNDSVVFSQQLTQGQQYQQLPVLKKGAYQCKLHLDDEVLSSYIYIEDVEINKSKTFFGISSLPAPDSIKEKLLIHKWRYRNLLRFAGLYGFDDYIDRKLTHLLFEYDHILYTFNSKSSWDNPGLHLGETLSPIDSIGESYMIYIPKSYNAEQAVPLILECPYILGRKARFFDSWRVADLDRIEYIKSLCDKYGFAYLWVGARVYDQYNLNPIVENSIFHVLETIQSSYNIDTNRIHAYGSCSGGLLAMLLTTRFPHYFAGLAVEGPELSYVLGSQSYPELWTERNSVPQHLGNLLNTPTLLLSSGNDTKTSHLANELIVDWLSGNGGLSELDDMENPTKNQKLSLLNENRNMSKIFNFLSTKSKERTQQVNFSTYQLKYGRSEWFTINSFEDYGKIAKVTGSYNPHKKRLSLQTENVGSLVLHTQDLPVEDFRDHVEIRINDQLVSDSHLEEDSVLINLLAPSTTSLHKTGQIEGPLNHCFASPFLLVEDNSMLPDSLKISPAIADNWQSNYFGSCMQRKPQEVSSSDPMNYNLVVCLHPGEHPLDSIIQRLPVQITQEFISIDNDTIWGKNLSFELIYPNPVNPEKYIVLLGVNSKRYDPSIFHDLPLKGWYDFAIYRSNHTKPMRCGYFDGSWHMPR